MTDSVPKKGTDLEPLLSTATKDVENAVAPDEPSTGNELRSSKVVTVLFLSLLFVLLLGMLCFEAVERPNEIDMHNTATAKYATFQNSLLILGQSANIASNRTEAIALVEVMNAARHAIPAPTDLENWGYKGSAFFTFTLMTTIGYGSFTPQTTAGKWFAMIFGALGIILFALFIGVLGSNLNKWVRASDKKLGPYTRYLLATFVVPTLWMLFGALVFLCFNGGLTARDGTPRKLDFLDSFYYCFITFTTIGLGDFSPAIKNVGGLLYFIFFATGGMVLLANCISAGSDMAEGMLNSMESQMVSIMGGTPLKKPSAINRTETSIDKNGYSQSGTPEIMK